MTRGELGQLSAAELIAIILQQQAQIEAQQAQIEAQAATIARLEAQVAEQQRAQAFSGELRFYKTALLLSPSGQILGRYHKNHPIPFFLDGVPGRATPTFATEAGQVVRNGAELLVVPTYDAAHWGTIQHQQHSAMTPARAVEHGRSVVRAASSGISQIVGPEGQLLASVPLFRSGAVAAVAPLRSGVTLHDRIGFLLPYLCGGATLSLWFMGLWRRPGFLFRGDPRSSGAVPQEAT